MTIYAPGTPQEAIDADQASQAGNDGPSPPAPPPRYDSGGIQVKTSASSSSNVRQWDPNVNAREGYGGYYTSYGGPPGLSVPPIGPQRPEGNISKVSGHVSTTFFNVNHEMPHTEWKAMPANQQRDFLYSPFGPCPFTQPAAPAAEEKKSAGEACGLCRKPGQPLRKFNHQDNYWTICSKCAGDAFAAEGVHLWCNGERV